MQRAPRRLLVQSAHYTLGPFGQDSDLRRWGMDPCPARVTAARKVAVLMHRLWVTGEEYEPLGHYQKRPTTQGASATAVVPA